MLYGAYHLPARVGVQRPSSETANDRRIILGEHRGRKLVLDRAVGLREIPSQGDPGQATRINIERSCDGANLRQGSLVRPYLSTVESQFRGLKGDRRLSSWVTCGRVPQVVYVQQWCL